MIALYIVGGIILLISVLLFSPVTVELEYDDKLKCKIKYLFFNYKIPNNENDKKKIKVKKKKKKKKNKAAVKKNNGSPKNESSISKNLKIIKTAFKFKGFDGAKKIIAIAAYLVKKISGLLRRHLLIKKLFIVMRVGSDDAANTSLKYGKLCAYIFPALGAVCNTMKVGEYDVNISPDFISTENKAYVYAKLGIKPAFVLAFLISVLFHLIISPIAKHKLDGINNKAVQTNEGK